MIIKYIPPYSVVGKSIGAYVDTKTLCEDEAQQIEELAKKCLLVKNEETDPRAVFQLTIESDEKFHKITFGLNSSCQSVSQLVSHIVKRQPSFPTLINGELLTNQNR